MNERIASGEIFVDLDDEAAIAGLRRVEATYTETMHRLDRQEATMDLRIDEKKLKEDLAKAKAETEKLQKYVKDADSEYTRRARRQSLLRAEAAEKEARAALKHHQAVMRAKDEQSREEARSDARQAAIARRHAARQRLLEQAESRRLAKLRDIDRFQGRMSKQREREMATSHRDALRMNQDLDNQALKVRKLQRQYAETHDTVRKLNHENVRFGKRLLRSPGAQQRIDLNIGEAEAKMAQLQAELRAMGARPIHQEIDLDVDERGLGTLNRWISAITETTVRVGPFTTTIAGLSRALLLLGPIISGLVGQASALVAVLGAGALGAVGVTAGAVGALGVSLGGVGLLLPSLLRDFKGLQTLQKAYHTQVLKTGANSEKAKVKLKEFNHALGEVEPTTRRAFLSLDKLRGRWRDLSHEARPTFFNMLGAGIDTINHHFDWFQKNTLNAFEHLERGWDRWMKGLRSGEADRILATLGTQGNRSIEPLMKGLGNLATFFGRVAESFSRHLPSLLRGFSDWSGSLAAITGDTSHLDRTTDGLVEAMRSVGHLAMSIGRVITAFFAPGVDDGTKMVEGWANSLDHLAERMRGGGRGGIDQWFRDSIDLANKFWAALKPLAQIFFEWTTIMRPFTAIALDSLKVLGDILQVLLDFGPTRTTLQAVFGVFLLGALLKRVAIFRDSLWSISRAIGAIKAAGGIGGAIKGGVIRFMSGGMAGRGTTPANPLFVMDVSGGGRGGPVAGGKGPGFGGLISQLPKFVKVGGAIGGVTAAVVGLTRAVDGLNKKHGLEQLDKKVQKFVGKRDMTGLLDLRKYVRNFGGDNKEFLSEIDKGIKAINNLDDEDLHRLNRSINEDYKRLSHESKVTFKRVSGLADYNFDLIEKTAKHGSNAARMAASRNFNKAKDAIKSAMKAGTIDTKKGLKLIEDLWVRALSQYGFTPKQARNIRKTGDPDANRGREGGAQRAMQSGGMIQVGRKGQRGRDTIPMNLGGVPSVVAPGEQIAVFNAHQQRKMAQTYPGGLEGFFSGPQRRHNFAPGGIVPVPGFPGERAASSVIPMIEKIAHTFHVMLSDAYGPGHKSPGHTIYGTAADFFGPDKNMDRAVAALVAQGFKVLYDGRFGSTAWPGHGPSYVAGGNAHFHVELGGKGGNLAALAPSIARVIMQTDLGSMSVAGQAALDIAQGAAQANLDKVFESMMSVGESQTGGAGAASRAQMIGWARTALSATAGLGHGGPTAGNIAKILELAMKESSWIVRSLNTWDSNAAAGNPSGGLMHVTLDKVGGSYARLYNPIDNMITSIRYQMSRYGHLVTQSPYAMGGLVPMAQAQWQRGGKIEQPTLMTGEDGRKHPEFVIGTNPMFKNSNLDVLRSAAAALGVPQARKSKSFRKPRYIKGEGKEPGRIKSVKKYHVLQRKEEDTQREISIASSRVTEPDTFIKKVGTDAEGNDLFAIDEKKITGYRKQLLGVRKLWDKLIRIMNQLAAVADASYKRIKMYVDARQKNIADLNKTIVLDRKLSKSKDTHTAARAQRRMDKAIRMRENQQQKISDARDIRRDISEDQHDANYRKQEYQIDRRNLQRDITAIRPGAVEEAAGANPQPTPPEPPEPVTPIFEQTRVLSEARSDLLTSMGSNFAAITRGLDRTAFGLNAIASPSYALNARAGLNAPPPSAAYSAVRNSDIVTRTPAAGGVRSAPAGGSSPMQLQSSPQGGAAMYTSGIDGGTSISVENINFPVAPTDPHTFSKNLLWELGALSN